MRQLTLIVVGLAILSGCAHFERETVAVEPEPIVVEPEPDPVLADLATCTPGDDGIGGTGCPSLED